MEKKDVNYNCMTIVGHQTLRTGFLVEPQRSRFPLTLLSSVLIIILLWYNKLKICSYQMANIKQESKQQQKHSDIISVQTISLTTHFQILYACTTVPY